MSNRGNSHSVGPYHEKILKQFEEWEKGNAYIVIEQESEETGETIKVRYSLNDPQYDYRQYAYDIWELDTKNKVDDLFRNSYRSRNEVGRKQNIRQNQKKVINDIFFEFNQNVTNRNPRKSDDLLSKMDLYVNKTFGEYRAKHVDTVYTDIRALSFKVKQRIYRYLENLFDENGIDRDTLDGLYHFLNRADEDCPFWRLNLRIVNPPFETPFDLVNKQLNELLEVYGDPSLGPILGPGFLPDYEDLEILAQLGRKNNVTKKDLKKSTNPLCTIFDGKGDIKFNFNFEDKQRWFEGSRIQKLKMIEESLFEKEHVTEWPPYVAAHILLASAEYIAVREEIVDKALEEVCSNVTFRISYGPPARDQEVQVYGLNVDEVAEELMNYEIVGELDNLIAVSNGRLLSQPLFRHTNVQASQNHYTPDEIKNKLLFTLFEYFFDEMSKHMHFNNADFSLLKEDIAYVIKDLITG